MKRIARFEKVSFGQFSDGWDDTFQASRAISPDRPPSIK